MDPRPAVSRLAAFSPQALLRLFVTWCDDVTSRLVADSYLREALRALSDDPARPATVRLAAADLHSCLRLAAADIDDESIRRRVHLFLERLAECAGRGSLEAAADRLRDTDVPRPTTREPDDDVYLPVVLWLPHIRSPFNVGNIIRSAAAFGIAGVVLGDGTPSIDHPRVRRAAMGALRMVPVLRGAYPEARRLLDRRTPGLADDAGGKMPLIALETEGIDVGLFDFPRAGVLALGHEELGLEAALCEAAQEAGMMVSVPHDGPKTSLNVGVAAGICLSWWRARIGSCGRPTSRVTPPD